MIFKFLLCRAIQKQNIELVEILIDVDVNVNDIHKFNHNEQIPLMIASFDDNMKMMLFLLRKEADINAIVIENWKTTTAFQISLYNRFEKNFNVCYFFLINGAKINLSITFFDFSKLIYSTQTNNIQIVRKLLNRETKVNSAVRHFAKTSFQIATWIKNVIMIQLLLKRKTEINASNKDMALQITVQIRMAAGSSFGQKFCSTRP